MAFPTYKTIALVITKMGVTPMEDKSVASKQQAKPTNIPVTIQAFTIPDMSFSKSKDNLWVPML